MNKKKRISSSISDLYRYYYLFFALAICFVLVFVLLTDFKRSNWLAFVIVLLIILIIYSIFKNSILNLKKVDIDSEFLYIQQRKLQAKIALSNIKSVRQINAHLPPRIEIQFKSETVFGNNIMFLARTEFHWLKTHPIISELDKIIKKIEND